MAIEISRRRLLAIGAAIPVAGTLASMGEAAASGMRPEVVALPPGASAFTSVQPARLADTRGDQGSFGFTPLGGNTIRVQVAGRSGVPADASAAVLNITVVNPVLAGYVSVYPSGTARPTASSVNVERPGQIVANLVTVRLGAGGAVDIFTQNPADIVVDVNGAYSPVNDAVAAGRFVALNAAYRVLDTRNEGAKVPFGGTKRVDVSAVVPASATAVVVNLTVTETNGAGFWTGYPAGGALPPSSSVNTDAPNQTRANQAILPVGNGGGVRGIDVYSSTGGHLIVDVAGYFTGTTDPVHSVGLFVPNEPYRTLDTRGDARYGRLYPGWIVEFDFAGLIGAQAVVVNLTTTETRGAGYFTGYPARTDRPLASNLNATGKNQTIANHAILRASIVGVAVFTQSGGHLVVDVAGYFMGQPAPAVLPQPINVVPPPPPPASLPYVITMPRIGKVGTIIEGVGSNVVDRGYIGHWPGTGFVGEQSHMVLFAHRTEHGGILRNMHLFTVGDEVSIRVPDGRVFHYGYVRRDITNSSATNIYNVGRSATLPSISLVGCTKLNYLPTDIKYRLVVTFTLLRVDEP